MLSLWLHSAALSVDLGQELSGDMVSCSFRCGATGGLLCIPGRKDTKGNCCSAQWNLLVMSLWVPFHSFIFSHREVAGVLFSRHNSRRYYLNKPLESLDPQRHFKVISSLTSGWNCHSILLGYFLCKSLGCKWPEVQNRAGSAKSLCPPCRVAKDGVAFVGDGWCFSLMKICFQIPSYNQLVSETSYKQKARRTLEMWRSLTQVQVHCVYVMEILDSKKKGIVQPVMLSSHPCWFPLFTIHISHSLWKCVSLGFIVWSGADYCDTLARFFGWDLCVLVWSRQLETVGGEGRT